MTPDDKLYTFQCGHVELNPHFYSNGKPYCKQCGGMAKIKYLVKSCADCGRRIFLTNTQTRTKYCRECGKIRKNARANKTPKKHAQQINKYQIERSENLKLFSSSADEDCLFTLEYIAEILPKIEGLSKLNSQLDKAENDIQKAITRTDIINIISNLYKTTQELETLQTKTFSRERIRQNTVLGMVNFKRRWKINHKDLPNPLYTEINTAKVKSHYMMGHVR